MTVVALDFVTASVSKSVLLRRAMGRGWSPTRSPVSGWRSFHSAISVRTAKAPSAISVFWFIVGCLRGAGSQLLALSSGAADPPPDDSEHAEQQRDADDVERLGDQDRLLRFDLQRPRADGLGANRRQ